MEFKNIDVTIERKEQVSLNFQQIELNSIVLTITEVVDLENFFNDIFEYVIENEKIPTFTLKDEKSDLFNNVSKDVINQLNSEIKQSESNFKEIISLLKK